MPGGYASQLEEDARILPKNSCGFSQRPPPQSRRRAESAVEKYVSAIFLKLGLTEENQIHRRVGAVLAFLRDEAAERHT
jgi:hypothetical protein